MWRPCSTVEGAVYAAVKNWNLARFPSLHHRKEGCLRHQENFAKPTKLTQTGWFSFCSHRKTTPAFLEAALFRVSTPPKMSSNRNKRRAVIDVIDRAYKVKKAGSDGIVIQMKQGTALFVLLVFSLVPFVFCSRFCWAKACATIWLRR